MSNRYNRRQMLKTMGAASAAICLPGIPSKANPRLLRIAEQDIEIQINPLSAHTVRLSLVPLGAGQALPIPVNGSLVPRSWPSPTVFRHAAQSQIVKWGDFNLRISFDPLTFTITTIKNREIQRLTVDAQTGALSFATGDSPLLGLGEGGPQFDRRGSTDSMISGQGGYQLATHGGRVPIPWLIGTSGWAMFIHQPFGTFDFRGALSTFRPANPRGPLDLFFVASSDPPTIMAEYAQLTGHAEIPPLWSFGYQQSHRTLASRGEVLAEAATFREKNFPVMR